MSAVDGAKPVGKQEVEDDTSPQVIRHVKRCQVEGREPFESKQRVRRQNKRPDLAEVGIRETKTLNHRRDFGGTIRRSGRGYGISSRWQRTRTLPERCLDIDIGKERTGN